MEALRILLDGNGEEEEKKEDVGKGGGLEQRETKTKLKVSLVQAIPDFVGIHFDGV